MQNNYSKLMTDNINYALIPNCYLEEIKKETNREKRFNLLKKYFVEKITTNLYQNMDLLHSTQTDFEQFKKMYLMIGKDLFMNILLAIDSLLIERGTYELDKLYSVNVPMCMITDSNMDSDNEYSICESYLIK